MNHAVDVVRSPKKKLIKHVEDAIKRVGDTATDLLHKLAPVIKMRAETDSDSGEDDKYHGSGQIMHPVENGTYDVSTDADIMDLVNKDQG